MIKFLKIFLVIIITNVFASSSYEIIEDQCKIKLLSPSLQNREVLKIRLKNDLNVFIVSDKKAEKSAAAISIEAGSWLDPVEYPGLAHFLEHMVLKNTATYPKEEEFSRYTYDHGGMNNAYTAGDRTVYSFCVNHSSFENALDRFSHCFIDPLLNTSDIKRELHAVDEEFSKNIEHDGWRKYLIFKETGNPHHPNSRFSTGNAQTLSKIPQIALKDWFEKYYSSNLMNLVIYTSLSFDEVIPMVVEKFIKIKNTGAIPIIVDQELSSNKQKGHYIYVNPIKNIQQLSLEWELPKSFNSDLNKTAELLSYLINHGHKNSLYEHLKKEELIEEIYSQTETLGNNHALFDITLSLTDKGIKNINKIIIKCFETLKNISYKINSVEKQFDEMNQMNLINYQYQSRKSAYNFVTNYASDLQDEDILTFPKNTFLATSFDKSKFENLLNFLTPKNCQFYILAPSDKTKIEPNRQEKWLGGEYKIEKISSKFLKTLDNLKKNSSIKVTSPNPYIPEKLEILNNANTEKPIPIINNSKGRFLYSYSKNYISPKASILLHLKTPFFSSDAKSQVLTEIYCKHIVNNIIHLGLMGDNAGLNFNCNLSDFKINFFANGYSEKLPIFFSTLFKEIKNSPLPTKEEFSIICNSLKNDYLNMKCELPFFQSRELTKAYLSKDYSPCSDKLKSIKTISFSDFQNFQKNLYKNTYIEGLVSGNLSIKDAESLWLDIENTLSSEPFLQKNHYVNQVLSFNNLENPLLISKKTKAQGNGVILTIDFQKYSHKNKGIQDILTQVLKDAFFNELRSKQKTSYIAASWQENVKDHLFQSFGVQSSSHEAKDLLSRFDFFLENFINEMDENISKERFEELKNNTIISLKTYCKNLVDYTFQIDLFAFEKKNNFNYLNERIDALQTLTYDDFLQTSKSLLSHDNKSRMAVLFMGKIPDEKRFYYKEYQDKKLKEMLKYEDIQ